MTVEEILEKLETCDYSNFQREALEAAIQNREAITPALLSIVERIADQPEYLDENPDYTGFLYALYLLAQFREYRAYPFIVRYFGGLGTEFEALDATGDIVTEDLGRILASVCHADLSLIKPVIEDPKVNEYVRSAGLTALVALYNAGQLAREDLIAYLQDLIDSKLEQDEADFILGSLVISAYDIYPGELYPVLVKCFERGLVDPFLISKKAIDRAMQEGQEQVLAKLKKDHHRQLIDNVITELQNWACFRPEPRSRPRPDFNYHVPTKKVGRNDPCPCGSGKKYKKCCLT